MLEADVGQHLQGFYSAHSPQAHIDLPICPSSRFSSLPSSPAAGESNIYRKPPIYKRHGQCARWLQGLLTSPGLC